MTVPAFTVGASLLFWGWESSNLVLAVPLALAIESLRRLDLRFDMEPLAYNRLADLSTVAFVALAGVLVANRGAPHGVLAAFQYMPLTLTPILLAQYASSARRIHLSALFQVVRKQKRRDPATKDPLIDLSAPYVAVALLAAGMANQRGEAYYLAVMAFAAWALWPQRPRQFPLGAWGAMFGLAAALGYGGHIGLSQLQEKLEDWVTEWQLRQNTDPSRGSTDMGSIGRLKQYDEILLRVHAPPEGNGAARLLHRASYNTLIGTQWLLRNAPLAPLQPAADGAGWQLAPGDASASLRISAKTDAGRALLPLPPGSLRISGLVEGTLRANDFGAVLVEAPQPWIRYEVRHGDTLAHYAPALPADLALPPPERELLERIAGELGLRGQPAGEVARRVAAYLAPFSYSTFRESAAPAGTTALGDFLARTKSGHCEYFAAATVLLLRAGGVPARYATGFAALEYSDLEEAWVVRARHAHAWARAWVDGRWIELDTTPPSWFAEEARQAPAWQPLADIFRWATWRWSQREQGAGAGDAWYGLAALLFAILAWRIVKGRRAAAAAQAPASPARRWQGEDSEFYALEAAIAARHGARGTGETVGAWLARVQPEEELHQRALRALALHQRYRFDPDGMDGRTREALRELCRIAPNPGTS